MLETGFNVTGQLTRQPVYRPPMPQTGHEYWPFDGEYWPDEIGYYKYTWKDACPAKKKEECTCRAKAHRESAKSRRVGPEDSRRRWLARGLASQPPSRLRAFAVRLWCCCCRSASMLRVRSS